MRRGLAPGVGGFAAGMGPRAGGGFAAAAAGEPEEPRGSRGGEDEERKKIKKMVGPTEGVGFGGPLGMEAWRGDLEGHAKWRGVWRASWS
jgi:hypothetical protein